jgi:hypothetical protein
MAAFQFQTFVPQDGVLSVTLPEHLRGKTVKLRAEPELPIEQPDDVFTLYCNSFRPADCPVMSDEEYLAGIRSLRGILAGSPDLSDLRDETDRKL